MFCWPDTVLRLGQGQVWRCEDAGAEVARHVHGGASLSLSLHCLETDWDWSCLFSEIICTTQVSPHCVLPLPLSPCLSNPEICYLGSIKSKHNYYWCYSPVQPCNQSQIISRMHRSKQWRPTNRIFLKDQSPHLSLCLQTRQGHPPWSPTLTLASHQLCCYRDRQRRERRESETDGRRLLWYCVVHYCTPLYSLYSSGPPPSPSSPSPSHRCRG